MKITWFGGGTFRAYIGGKIFVTNAAAAPSGYVPHEIAAAADYEIDLTDGVDDFPPLPVETWTQVRHSPLDEPVEQIAALYTISGEALFIDEPNEGPLVLAPAGQTAWGRFADESVVVFYGDAAGVVPGIQSLLKAARPKLIAIAADNVDLAQINSLANVLGQTTLQIMEPGLALEA